MKGRLYQMTCDQLLSTQYQSKENVATGIPPTDKLHYERSDGDTKFQVMSLTIGPQQQVIGNKSQLAPPDLILMSTQKNDRPSMTKKK